jgi:outer membrane biosynthesis protein TonB
VQTRTYLLGTAVIGAALFLDLAVLDVARPIAGAGAASPVATAPPTTVPGSLGTEAPLPTTAPAVATSAATVPPVASTQPTVVSSVPAQPVAPGTAAPVAPPVAADATTRTAPTPAQPVQPVQPARPVTTPSPSTTLAPSTTVASTPPVTTAAPTTQATTTTQAPAAVEYRTYGVDAVGSVVLAYTGSSITLSSTSLGAGWVYRAETNGPRTVKLNFFNTDTEQEAEWKATIESGRILIED